MLIEYSKGNHILAINPTLVTEKVRQYLTKCMDYHQTNIVIISNHVTIIYNCTCYENVETVQQSAANTFIHLLVPENNSRHNDSFLI